jgi:hypothetical protein
MVKIGRLSGLVRLELGQTSVTDLGLIQLSGLTKLEDLEQAARGTRRTRSNTVILVPGHSEKTVRKSPKCVSLLSAGRREVQGTRFRSN